MAAVAKGPHILQKNPPAEFSGYVLAFLQPLPIFEPLVVICVMCDNQCTAIAYCGLTPIRQAARLIIRSLRSTNPI